MKNKKKLIIDASCIMAVIKQEETADIVINKTSGYQLFSANCLSHEIGNSLSKCLKRNLLTLDQAINCFELYKKLPITLLEIDFENAIRFSANEHHYAYDMYYLDCAVRNACPLLTFDEELISIAKKRGVVCL